MKRRTPFLFPPLSRDPAPLALRPLLIAGMVVPVHDGDGGVNVAMRDDNPNGLMTAIDPYQRMLAGDKHEIFWSDVNIAQREVQAGEEDERLFVYLPTATILPDWAERVYYKLTRAGSTTAEDGTPLRLRVKLDLPAGTDEDPHLPGHSELQAPGLPQDVIDNGVDAGWAARGVPVEIATYPGRAPYDTIQLRWGSVSLVHNLTEAEAGGTASITITVDQAAILAGGDSDALLVHYQVFDEVWNFSTEWSLQTRVMVDAGAWRLDAPIIKESIAGNIDLIALGRNDVTVQIAMSGAPYAVGDSITMTWIGTPATGLPITHTQTMQITSVPAILEPKVPNADVRAIAQGSADASYVLNKANGDPPQSSKRTFANVIGDISLLPAPTIRELVGDVLEPDTLIATVLIPAYPGMANGDLINMVWLGTQSNGTPYVHEQEHPVTQNEVGTVIPIYVANEHIAVLDFGTLDLYYIVTNDSRSMFAVSESDHAAIKVQQARAELPAPKVVQAPDDVLDPALVPDSATLLINYLGTVAGDELTYYWTGRPGNGTGSDWVPITTPTAGKPISFRIDSALITPNIGSIVMVRYSLKLKATGLYKYSAVLELTVGSLVGELPEPLVLEAPTGVLNPMDAIAGVVTRARYDSMDPALDTITLKWLGTPGAGTSDDLELPGSSTGYVDFPVPASVVGPNIGKQVDVNYEVKRYGLSSPSDVLELTVSNFSNPETELPRPRITQANDTSKELILDSFTGNASVTVGKWPFSAAGQRVWLRVSGTGSTGAVTVNLLAGVAISAAQASNGLNEQLIRTELEKLSHDTALTVTCKVTFDGATQEASAIEFPVARYTFKTFDDSVVPTITSVRDVYGEVVNGGTSFETSVTLTGTAAANKQVQILDGTTSLGTVTATGVNWTLALTGLVVKAYSLTAKGLYGSEPVSTPARTFTVAVATVPTITSVRDSKGEVANGGETVDTSVALAGKAAANQSVQILDNAANKVTAPVNASGDWSSSLTGLSLGGHSVTAMGLYGSNPVSNARTFTVRSPTPPLVIDTSPVTLGGLFYIWSNGHMPPTPPAGTSVHRSPSQGVPPYSYRSSNGAVASVTSTGLVRALKDGTTTITVSDNAGRQASYQVSVSNGWEIHYWDNMIWNAAVQYIGPGQHLPSGSELQTIRQQYIGSWPYGELQWWSSDARQIDALVVGIPSGSAVYILKAWSQPVLVVYKK